MTTFMSVSASVVSRLSDGALVVGVDPQSRAPSLYYSPDDSAERISGGQKTKLPSGMKGLYHVRPGDTEQTMKTAKIDFERPGEPLDAHVKAWVDGLAALRAIRRSPWGRLTDSSEGAFEQLGSRLLLLREIEDSYAAAMTSELTVGRVRSLAAWSILERARVSLSKQNTRSLHQALATATDIALYGFALKLANHSDYVFRKTQAWVDCAVDCLGIKSRDHNLQAEDWNETREQLEALQVFWGKPEKSRGAWVKELTRRQGSVKPAHKDFAKTILADDLLAYSTNLSQILTQLTERPDLVTVLNEKLGLDQTNESLLSEHARAHFRTQSSIKVFELVRSGKASLSLEFVAPLQAIVVESKRDAPRPKLPRWQRRPRKIQSSTSSYRRGHRLGRNSFGHLSSTLLGADLSGPGYARILAQFQTRWQRQRSEYASSVDITRFPGSYTKQKGTKLTPTARGTEAERQNGKSRSPKQPGAKDEADSAGRQSSGGNQSSEHMKPAPLPGIPDDLASFTPRPVPLYMIQLEHMLERSMRELMSNKQAMATHTVRTEEPIASSSTTQPSEPGTIASPDIAPSRLQDMLLNSIQDFLYGDNADLTSISNVNARLQEATASQMREEEERRVALGLLASTFPQATAGRSRLSSCPPALRKISEADFGRQDADKGYLSEDDGEGYEDEPEGYEEVANI